MRGSNKITGANVSLRQACVAWPQPSDLDFGRDFVTWWQAKGFQPARVVCSARVA